MTANTNNSSTGIIPAVVAHIKETVLTKSVGFYVAAVAWLLTLIHTITYASGVPGDIYSGSVVGVGVTAIILFPLLSLSKKTSPVAPIVLMICDFMALMCMAGADGIIDYMSTQFFDGFSVGKIFTLPFGVWFSALSFIVSFIIASVAMYLPQQKKSAPAVIITEEKTNE